MPKRRGYRGLMTAGGRSSSCENAKLALGLFTFVFWPMQVRKFPCMHADTLILIAECGKIFGLNFWQLS